MSELVEESFLVNFQSNLNSGPNCPSQRDQIFDGLGLLIQRANIQGYNIKIQEAETIRSLGRLKAIAHIKYTSSMFDVVFQILVDLRNKKIQLKTSFIEQQQYLCIQSSLKRTMACRKLLKINNEIQLEGFKFIQDMQNGKIILMGISSEPEHTFNSKETIWNKVKTNLRKLCQICTNHTMQIIQICDRELFKKYHLKNGGEEQKKIKKQVTSYLKLIKQIEVSHINFGFSSRDDESSFPSLQRFQSHEGRLKGFLMNTFCDNFQASSKKLFLTSCQELYEIPQSQINYEIQASQTKIYSSYLKSPVPRDPNPGQNKFIFNHIQLVKPQSVKFRETGLEGGLNKIIFAKASFYYCDSSAAQKMKNQQSSFSGIPSFFCMAAKTNQFTGKKENPILTKTIAVKVPKKKTNEKQDKKHENEKNIIRLFKNGVSAYILKYYVSNQRNFEYKNSLLIDFLPNSQPLSNYIEIFKETLSLNSKTFLIVNIINALRFLNDYQIVHMDLNLNNFLVFRDYLTKLIDFGEAYNSNVSKMNGADFKRGYTFPFCSPEYFERTKNFSSKQDIFSLGMIIWRLIFNDYPFFGSNKAKDSYKDKSYMKKIMLAPERGEGYGKIQTIDLIYRLLFKCLSPNQIFRCESSWLTIFFKIIYFYLL